MDTLTRSTVLSALDPAVAKYGHVQIHHERELCGGTLVAIQTLMPYRHSTPENQIVFVSPDGKAAIGGSVRDGYWMGIEAFNSFDSVQEIAVTEGWRKGKRDCLISSPKIELMLYGVLRDASVT